MPIDVSRLLTKADHRLVAKAAKRGPVAAKKVMDAIAKRAAQTAFDRNEKIADELKDDTDRCWPPSFLKGTK
jgi:hypothetical protein